MASNLSELLQFFGLKEGASSSDLRKVYTERLKTAHPDKGGSVAEFRELSAKYTALVPYLPVCGRCGDTGYIETKGLRQVCGCQLRK